ncbi:SDR family NAD(P)-dependent oxidoreductase [Candidatus Pelagibacter sp.]|uniref:SDR family NAD(P)-dependent oxidoreductase n=1 Tax=Candidatus Pelagibacter sp. TaxID=2024849 RepID=UPI003F85858C
MRILVTGAAGFIGSHLCEALLAKKYKVRALVRYNSNQSHGWLENINHKNLELVRGDITDFDSVNNALINCDYVFNLAASISVPYSFKNPQTFIDTNILGALNIFRSSTIKKNKIKKIIQISSSEVYGNDLLKNSNVLTENTITVSESPYAASKIAADNLAISMFKATGLPVVVARPFNTFGPRQSLRAVIPTIISQFATLDKYNNVIRVGNLKTSRDFVYVKDTVSGLINLLKPSCKPGEIYNICTGKSFKINDVILSLKKITNLNPQIIVSKNRFRKAEVYNLRGSNKKIYNSTKWKPKYLNYVGFQRALAETYEWFKDEKNLSKYTNIHKYNI